MRSSHSTLQCRSFVPHQRGARVERPEAAARDTQRNDGWSLGENLAWGSGELGTARGIHEAWMRSNGHRANILNPDFRELGIGIRPGVPKDATVGATYTANFGVKL